MNTDCWGVVERKLREYTNPWFALARRKKLNRADLLLYLIIVGLGRYIGILGFHIYRRLLDYIFSLLTI